jgi:DNA-binding transcriptional LysR family regulator
MDTKRPLDTDQLITFLELVKVGSFSGAARSLQVSQPTVTARIQALESAVGGLLVTRAKGSMRLTDMGQRFLPFARRSVETIREGVQVARDSGSDHRGHINIAAFSSVAATLLAEALLTFARRLPNVSVTVREEFQEHILPLLDDGVVELAHLLWPWHPAGRDILPLVVTREEMIFVTAPTHPLADVGEVSLEDVVAADAFFHLGSGDLFRPIKGRRQDLGFRSMEVPLTTARYIIGGGVGVGLLTLDFVKRDLESGALVRLTGSELVDSRQTALVHHRRRGHLTPAASEFVREFEAAARAGSLTARSEDRAL